MSKAKITNLTKFPLHLGDDLGGKELGHGKSFEVDAEIAKTHEGIAKLLKKDPPAVSVEYIGETQGTVSQPTADEIIETETVKPTAPAPVEPPAPAAPAPVLEPENTPAPVLEPETGKEETLEPKTETQAPADVAAQATTPVDTPIPQAEEVSSKDAVNTEVKLEVETTANQSAPAEETKAVEVKAEETVVTTGAAHKKANDKKKDKN